MRSIFSLLTSAAALLLPAAWGHAAPPQRLEIVYQVLRDGSRLADIVERLEHGNGKYRIEESWQGRGFYALAGSISRVSQGTVGAGGLRPVEFTDKRTGRGAARVTFDWPANSMTLQRKGKTRTLPIPPDAQDRLSFFLSFVFSPPGEAPVRFSVVDGGGISNYIFEIAGREQLKLPAGEFDTVKLVRRREGADDRRSAVIWLAPAHGHIPVRIVVTEKDGVRTDQQAARISIP